MWKKKILLPIKKYSWYIRQGEYKGKGEKVYEIT